MKKNLLLFCCCLLFFAVQSTYAQTTCTGNVPITNLTGGMDYTIVSGPTGDVDVTLTVVNDPGGLVGFFGGIGGVFQIPMGTTFTYNFTGQTVGAPFVVDMFFNWGGGGSGFSETVTITVDGACAPVGGPSSLEFPITFDDITIDYDLNSFGSNMSASLTADPVDAGNMVLSTNKTAGADCWSGVTVGDSGLDSEIPFTATNTTIMMDVYSPEVGAPILLKVEDATNGAISSEVIAVTTVANAWETLVFDFANGCANPLNLANTYDKISVFPEFTCDPDACGVANPGTAPDTDATFYFDNIEMPPPPLALPIDFNSLSLDYELAAFGSNMSATIGADPTDSGNPVLCANKTAGADCWSGVTVGEFGLEEPIPFGVGNMTITVDVYSPEVGAPILLKVEDASNGGISSEVIEVTTVANTWETLRFDFSNGCAGPPNLANTYDKISIFPEFTCDPDACGVANPGTAPDTDAAFYFDNIEMAPPPTSADVTFEVDLGCLDSATAPAVFGSFNGWCANCNLLTDQGGGIWRTTINIPNGNYFYKFFIQEGEESFELGDPCTGNNNGNGDRVLSVSGSDILESYGWNSCDTDCTPPPPKPDLPITFDDIEVDYSLRGFDGAAGNLGVDPDDAGNMVLCVNKDFYAAPWGGSVVADFGLENGSIPFTADEQVMTMRVWSPVAGVPIMLKVENVDNPGIFSESPIVYSTVAGAWETMEFDFGASNQPINLGTEYGRLAVFPNFFGDMINNGQYYFDDIMMKPCPEISISCPDGFDVYTDQYTCLAYLNLAPPTINDDYCVDFVRARVRMVDPVTHANIGPWMAGWADNPNGYYPAGTYKVRWRVQDTDGNRQHCRYFVNVYEVLPCPWIQEEDGVGCEDGSEASYDNETEEFTLESNDCHNGISSDGDGYAFVQREICGNGSITAHVTSLDGNANGWAGVMMRESNDPDAPSVNLSTNLSSNHRKQVRSSYGGNATSQQSSAFNRHWLRIVRNGNSFRGYASSNGSSWFLKFSHTVPMGSCIEVGLSLSSYVSSGDHTATFGDVVVEGGDGGNGIQNGGFQGLQTTDSAPATFSVYPNPTADKVTVNLSEFAEQEGQLQVLDVHGKVVQNVREGVLENSTEELHLGELPSGVYFVRLQLADGTVQMKRVVLQPRA